MNKIFQVQGMISKITTMTNKGLRIVFDTMEDLSGDAMERLFALYNMPGWMTVNVHQIEAEDIVDLPPVLTDDKKTPAQRLRNRMFVYFSKAYPQRTDFNAWYIDALDRIGQSYLDKIHEEDA